MTAVGTMEALGALSSVGWTRVAPRKETHNPQLKKSPSSRTVAVEPGNTCADSVPLKRTPLSSSTAAGWHASFFVTIE
ncbi:MAG: hypothetical protein AB7S52_07530 [Sphaerochaetaceae bacterium]